MPRKSVEIRKDVLRTLEDLGASDICFGRDGASHQTATFKCHDKTLHFHFPSTGRMRGCSYNNVLARLKRIVREASNGNLKTN